MLAKAIKLGAFGFLLGMPVGVLVVIAIGFAQGGELSLPPALLAACGGESGALLAQMLLSGAFGFVPMAGVVIYDIDSWGLIEQAAVHYFSYTIAFLLVGSAVGWVGNPRDIAMIAGVFLVVHCIIWAIMYARYKAQAEELNALLRETKRSAL